jgi:hypothetical protein
MQTPNRAITTQSGARRAQFEVCLHGYQLLSRPSPAMFSAALLTQTQKRHSFTSMEVSFPNAEAAEDLIKDVFGGGDPDDLTEGVQGVFKVYGHQLSRPPGPKTLCRLP